MSVLRNTAAPKPRSIYALMDNCFHEKQVWMYLVYMDSEYILEVCTRSMSQEQAIPILAPLSKEHKASQLSALKKVLPEKIC
jgi:hypothetical protein